MKEKSYISRKEQAVLTKKKIFDTTVLLIKKKGYNKITIREICNNAEISVGTFYLYFLSKDDILLDIYNGLVQNLTDAQLPDSNLTVSGQILQYIEYFLRQLQNSFDKDLIQEIYRINISSGQDVVLSPDNTLFQSIVRLLEHPTDTEHVLYSCTPETLTRRIMIFVHGFLMHWLVEESDDFEKMLGECLTELNHYLSLYFV